MAKKWNRKKAHHIEKVPITYTLEQANDCLSKYALPIVEELEPVFFQLAILRETEKNDNLTEKEKEMYAVSMQKLNEKRKDLESAGIRFSSEDGYRLAFPGYHPAVGNIEYIWRFEEEKISHFCLKLENAKYHSASISNLERVVNDYSG